MFRKMILSFMLTCTVGAWGYTFYQFFVPEVAPILYTATIEEVPAEAAAFALSSNTAMSARKASLTVVFYCTADNGDCTYINDQILPQVAFDLQVSTIDEIKYVDVAKLDAESAQKRKSEYGFSTYPAFVLYQLDSNNAYIPIETLEFNKQQPLTTEELEAWLEANKIVSFY